MRYLGNFRIVTTGPLSASGGMMMFTREPSGKRASSYGFASSTRRPIGAMIRSITRMTCSSLTNVTSESCSLPLRSTYVRKGPLTMTSVMVSSLRSGSIGPKPRISSRICSSIRWRAPWVFVYPAVPPPFTRAPAPSPPGCTVARRRFWDADEDQRGGLASEKAHTARAGRSLGTGGGGLGRARRQALRKGKDVLGDLAFAVTDNEWNPAVDRQYQSAAVRDDRVRDLAAEARFDVRGLDAAGAVVTVRDELQLLVAVAELLRDLHEHAHVLETRDLERHEREDHVGHVEHRDDLF